MEVHSHKDDEEGFLVEERMSIRTMEESAEVTIRLPEGKDLTDCGRPTEILARCLIHDKICLLPQSLNRCKPVQEPKQQNSANRPDSRISVSSSKRMHQRTESFQQVTSMSEVIASKRVYNGQGKTLYDFFESTDNLQSVYRKTADHRPMQEIIYDYTAQPKILELSNDYNPKLYRQLTKPHVAHEKNSDLIFDSNFQSGNLSRAFRLKSNPFEYYLLLDNDTNTHGYNQWFFFRVKNSKVQTYTFHILNMTKKSSLYKLGMKVSIFSEKQNKSINKGWFKGGEDISYTNTKIQRTTRQNQYYYALAWSYTFEEEEDTVHFALNQPYTYTRLANFIKQIGPVFLQNRISVIKKNIGYTLGNNIIQSLTITDQHIKRPKKVLLFMARQHPCETAGSFVAEGLLKAFSHPSPEAAYLIKHYRLVIIPMINPDGVIYGNSRCNLAGLDLNRQWNKQSFRELTPQTFAIRKYIVNLHMKHGIEAMIDLHGHSKKMNSFFYACKKQNKCSMRLLSYAMGKIQESFDIFSCTYGLPKDKAATARAQLFQMGINAYTLQNSYFGRQKNNSKRSYFENDLHNIGFSLVKALFIQYADKEVVNGTGFKLSRQALLQQIQTNLEKFEAEENKNKNDSGSQSDPDGDILALEQRVLIIKHRDEVKREKLIRSFEGIFQKKRYMSPILKSRIQREEQAERSPSYRLIRLNKDKSTEISKQFQTSKHIVTEPVDISSPLRRVFRPPSSYNKKTIPRQQIKNPQNNTNNSKPTQKKSKSFLYESNPGGLYDKQSPQQSPQTESRISQKQPSTKTFMPKPSPKQKRILKTSIPQNRNLKPTRKLTEPHQPNKMQFQDKRVSSSNRKLITQPQQIVLNLGSDSMQKSCELLKKQTDETEFIKVESLYKQSRRAREFMPTQIKIKKTLRLHNKPKPEERPQTCERHAHPRYRKFESFLTNKRGTLALQYPGLFGNYAYAGDYNSVFYHFPLL